jgi:hypothetical protein
MRFSHLSGGFIDGQYPRNRRDAPNGHSYVAQGPEPLGLHIDINHIQGARAPGLNTLASSGGRSLKAGFSLKPFKLY